MQAAQFGVGNSRCSRTRARMIHRQFCNRNFYLNKNMRSSAALNWIKKPAAVCLLETRPVLYMCAAVILQRQQPLDRPTVRPALLLFQLFFLRVSWIASHSRCKQVSLAGRSTLSAWKVENKNPFAKMTHAPGPEGVERCHFSHLVAKLEIWAKWALYFFSSGVLY